MRKSRYEVVSKVSPNTVVEQLGQDDQVDRNVPFMLPDAEWQKNFEALLATAKSLENRYPPGFEADISRDTIYKD